MKGPRDTGRGTGPTGDLREVANQPLADDLHASAVLEARLGRPARDVLEATVVLEAWTGRPAAEAMSAAQRLVQRDGPPQRALGAIDPFEDAEHTSVISEGLTLVLLIVSIAAWAAPIRAHLGPRVLEHAIRVALPLAVAFQWGLRSRYLGRPQGLACLARDGIRFWVAILIVICTPLVFVPSWGPTAAMLIPIWVGSMVLTRRGWGLVYAGVLVIGTVALDNSGHPQTVLAAITAVTLLMCFAAIRTSRSRRSDARPGSVERALAAALIGGMTGVLLVGDPTVGLGVHGLHPAVALLPSVIGSYWGGFYLWNFFEAVPRGLRGVSLERAGSLALSDPPMSIFLGAILRLLIAVVVLSGVVIALGGLLGGTDALTVFIAFGCAGTFSMLVGMLEAFALQTAALVAASAALITELEWTAHVHSHSPGTALAVGAAVGIVLTLPGLLVRLAHSGGTLATTMWIQ